MVCCANAIAGPRGAAVVESSLPFEVTKQARILDRVYHWTRKVSPNGRLDSTTRVVELSLPFRLEKGARAVDRVYHSDSKSESKR
jgi:hypothetical protein